MPNPTPPLHTAEIVLGSCTSLCGADGSALPLDAAKRAELEKYITGLARQSLRAISLAHRVVSEGGAKAKKAGGGGGYEAPEDLEELEAELTLDAIVGITVRLVCLVDEGCDVYDGVTDISPDTNEMATGPAAAGGDGGGAAVPEGGNHGAHGHRRQRRDGQGTYRHAVGLDVGSA
jgi:hypothetical protein